MAMVSNAESRLSLRAATRNLGQNYSLYLSENLEHSVPGLRLGGRNDNAGAGDDNS
jgi:hypothetical protein